MRQCARTLLAPVSSDGACALPKARLGEHNVVRKCDCVTRRRDYSGVRALKGFPAWHTEFGTVSVEAFADALHSPALLASESFKQLWMRVLPYSGLSLYGTCVECSRKKMSQPRIVHITAPATISSVSSELPRWLMTSNIRG